MAKAESKDRVIEIPEIRLQRLSVEIAGATPLLVDRFSEAELEKIRTKQEGRAAAPRGPRDPEEEFRAKLYVIDAEAGRYGFPAAGLKKALVCAGGRFADGTMTVLRGVLNIEAELLEIRGGAPVLHTAAGRLQGRTAMPIHRPLFWPWSMDVPIVFNSGIISEAQILNLLQIAGFSIGIGAWRPEKSGTFGQFTIRGARR